jgi:hypothetical protein
MRAKTWVLLLAVPVLLAVALSEVQGQPPAAPDAETQRIIRGFNIAPVPLKLRGRNRALVGLGSYIVPQLGPLLQVMPWPVYSHMIERDLRAVYEFLRSIPSIGNDN